jgi:hypothetical protein
MSLKLGGPLDDPSRSPDTESRPYGSVFGCATPLAQRVKPAPFDHIRSCHGRWDDRTGSKLVVM